FDQTVYGMEHFPSEIVVSDVLAVVAIALLISLGATIYPAWRASRMDPAEALRYE
ncbi:MAG: lipoprotein-releasing system transmembrane subunit, LolC/LolE family, partial [Deltaproteobacteria bacterium]|nr:lipoprotein-releasing system transmembrane subunit, LolC/LolE family [Deltaproteobacteria bacterium]